MKKNTVFSPRRFFLLLWNDLFLNRFLFFITGAAVTGLLLLIYIWDVYSPLLPRFPHHIYLGTLYLGGGALSWKIFSDLHNETKNPSWLTFPASMLEKFASRVVLSTVIFTGSLMVFFPIVFFLMEGVNRMLSGPNHILLNPFNKVIMVTTGEFLVYQSMFMLGLIYFKKYAPAKATLAVVAYILLGGIIALFVMNIVFGKYSEGFTFTLNTEMIAIGSHMDAGLKAFLGSDEAAPILKMVGQVYSFFFFYIFMPLCWITGYFRLKETEV